MSRYDAGGVGRHPWRHHARDIHTEVRERAAAAGHRALTAFKTVLPPGLQSEHWRVLPVHVTYTPKVFKMESNLLVEVWMSRAHDIRDEPIQCHAFEAKAHGSTSYVAKILAPAGLLPADTTLYVQAYSSIRTDDGEDHTIEAGFGGARLADVVHAGETGVTVPLTRVALLGEPMGLEADRRKGTVRFVLDEHVEFGAPLMTDFVDENQQAHRALLESEIAALGGPLDPHRHRKYGFVFPHTSPETVRVRVEQCVTGPATVHGWAYFSMLNRTPPDPAAIVYYLHAAIASRGMSRARFADVATRMDRGDEVAVRDRVAVLNVLGEAMTLLVNALFYVSDYAVIHDPATHAESYDVVECFDDGPKRGSSDCEDDAHAILETFLFMRDEYAGDDPAMRAAQAVLRHYIGAGTLMSVSGAQLADAAGGSERPPRLDDPAFDEGVGAHMAAVLLPRCYVARRLAATYPSVDWDVALGCPEGADAAAEREHFPPLLLEGTGAMDALLLPATQLYGEKEGLEVLARRSEAVERIVAPNVVRDIQRGGAPRTVAVPDYWNACTTRRVNELPEALDPGSVPNEFYRYYATLFFVSNGPLDFDVEAAGARVTMRHVTPCTDRDAHGRGVEARGATAGRMCGAPVYDVMTASDHLTLLLHPGPSDLAMDVVRTWGRHMASTARFTLPAEDSEWTGVARAAFDVVRKIFAATGRLVDAEPLDTAAGSAVEVWRGRSRVDLIDVDQAAAFAAVLKTNEFVAWLALEMFVLREGVAVVDLRIGVRVV
ncbi:MAG TPA: hypothetical protein VKD22_09090 [Ramlibacter sp.]|nr:hypothetical protein [Ramlibacter sp.]